MLVQIKLGDVSLNAQIQKVWVILYRGNEVECASDKISDDDCHKNEPEHSVYILHDLLEYNFFGSRLSTEDCLHHRVDFGKIKKVDNSWDSHKSH